MRHIFHLSIPVADLDVARAFYERLFDARVGRTGAGWLDILVWGHQITLQLSPEEVLAADEQGKRHFGVVLPWAQWQALASKLESTGAHLLRPPVVLYESTPDEQAKLYVQDPGNNVIEIKAYRDFRHVLGTDNDDYIPGKE